MNKKDRQFLIIAVLIVAVVGVASVVIPQPQRVTVTTSYPVTIQQTVTRLSTSTTTANVTVSVLEEYSAQFPDYTFQILGRLDTNHLTRSGAVWYGNVGVLISYTQTSWQGKEYYDFTMGATCTGCATLIMYGSTGLGYLDPQEGAAIPTTQGPLTLIFVQEKTTTTTTETRT